MRDWCVRCGNTESRPLGALVADTCCRRICCSQAITKSSHRICESQGQARYTRSARARNIAMCQSQSQIPYTRSARTTMIVAVNNMPKPFFALALGLVYTSEFLPGKTGAGTTWFHFTLSPAFTQWSFSTRTKSAGSSSERDQCRSWVNPGIARAENNESALPQTADVRADVAQRLRRAMTRHVTTNLLQYAGGSKAAGGIRDLRDSCRQK
jgi:hypothetical protein